jgi:hypothetical protein
LVFSSLGVGELDGGLAIIGTVKELEVLIVRALFKKNIVNTALYLSFPLI